VGERYFSKYDLKGAYHWAEYHGGLRSMNAYTKARYDMILSLLHEAPPGRVADIGCGDGVLAGLLSRDRDVVGIDTNAKAIDLAREAFAMRGLKGTFLTAEGYHSPLPDGSIAVAVSSDVIEHVAKPESLLLDMYRILQLGGWAILTTPIKVSDTPFDPLHVQEWFTPDFVELCAKVFGSPLKVIRSHPLFWYEVLVSPNPWLRRFGRLGINAMTRLGRNPFLEQTGRWRIYTTQCVVMQKAPSAP